MTGDGHLFLALGDGYLGRHDINSSEQSLTIYQQKSLQDKVCLFIDDANPDSQTIINSLIKNGADIAIVYTDRHRGGIEKFKELVSAANQRWIMISPDEDGIVDPNQIIARIVENLGRLDFFINNVSGLKPIMGKIRRYSHFEIMAAALRHIVEVKKKELDKTLAEQRRIRMQIAKKLLNKPIISVKEGQELGKVQDIYLDPNLETIKGVYLGKEGLLTRQETLIKWENVVTLGSDALLVDKADALIEPEQLNEFSGYIRRDDLVGRPIDTPGGTKIGHIDDIVIDEHARVAGFSMSRIYVSGPIADNQAISRSAVVDTGNVDGVMTAEIADAEEADLKVVSDGLFARPSVAQAEKGADTK